MKISGFCAECGRPIAQREQHLRRNVGVYLGPFGKVRRKLVLCSEHSGHQFVAAHTRRLKGLMVEASRVVEGKKRGAIRSRFGDVLLVTFLSVLMMGIPFALFFVAGLIKPQMVDWLVAPMVFFLIINVLLCLLH